MKLHLERSGKSFIPKKESAAAAAQVYSLNSIVELLTFVDVVTRYFSGNLNEVVKRTYGTFYKKNPFKKYLAHLPT